MSSITSASSDASARYSIVNPQAICVVVGILAAGVSTFLATQQEPPMDVRNRGSLVKWFFEPIEINPELRFTSVMGNFWAVAAVPGKSNRVCVVGDDDLILLSKDNGRTWIRVELSEALRTEGSAPVVAPGRRLYDVTFVDSSNGWIVGTSGLILKTEDGGDSWQKLRSPAPSCDLTKVSFRSADEGLVIARGQSEETGHTVWQTTDGGKKWSAVNVENGGNDLWCNIGTDGQGYYVVGDSILRVPANAVSARKERIPGQPSSLLLCGVSLPSQSSGWAVGSVPLGGQPNSVTSFIFQGEASSDQKLNWSVVYELETHLTATDFSDENNGWAVGDKGTILATTNSASDNANWQEQSSGVQNNLRDISFRSSSVGWVIGENATLIATDDGGKTWFPQVRQQLRNQQTEGTAQLLPAPWYFVAVLVSALLIILGLNPRRRIRRSKVTPPESSISERFDTDLPLDSACDDRLNFRPTAFGLSGFLRNQSTKAPLTVSIEGEWGSGKSSMMNLIRESLKRHGHLTVWFNAWHHQKGEHLLASLLQNVSRQAVPPFWSPRGVLFRVTLFRRRFGRPGVWGLFLVAVAAMGFYWNAPKLPSIPVEPITMAISMLTGLFGVLRGMTAFGANPAALFVGEASGRRARIRDRQTGFRYDFAQEFREVTESFRNKKLVVFIDDLDRCRPENVLDLLEAVNFLVSSGECFVVLGMDINRVRQCVALQFRDENTLGDDPEQAKTVEPASEQSITANGNSCTDDPRSLDFADHYLEKLINIRVTVPSPEEDQIGAFSREGNEGPQSLWKRIIIKLPKCADCIWRILLLIIALYLAWQVGIWVSTVIDKSSTRDIEMDGSINGSNAGGLESADGIESNIVLQDDQPPPETVDMGQEDDSEEVFEVDAIPLS